jgi:glycosyltransferase involved in cell wall biosynthesis
MAFNEAPTLAAVVTDIERSLPGPSYSHEIILVDDGSDDGTEEITARLPGTLPHLHVIRHTHNKGLGEVYRSGFRQATGELVTFLPADGQFPAQIVRDFADSMEGVDLILGYLSRRPGSSLARTLSKIERLMYRLVFGPLPHFQGILMFRQRMLEDLQIQPSGRGWGVLMEIIVLASRMGLRIRSMPTEVRPRLQGRSKVISLRSVLANVRQAVALRWALTARLRRLPREHPVVGKS